MALRALSSVAPITDAKEVAEVANESPNETDGQARLQAEDSAAPLMSRRPSRYPLRDPLVWIDLEMTGLDVEKDTIIEIACVITDGTLNRQIEGPSIAIHHPDDVLDGMGEWCREHHGRSGLTNRCRASLVSLADAERQVLEFIKQHIRPDTAQIAGNSVHVDKEFLKRHMPKLEDYLSYRILDVSTLKEICRRWYPKEWRKAPRKKNNHTALSDILESIEELKYYRTAIFKRL